MKDPSRIGLIQCYAASRLLVRRRLITPEKAARFFRVPLGVVQAVWPRVPFAIPLHVLVNSGNQVIVRQYVSSTENLDLANILTEEELIERLYCSKEWLKRKRLKQCWNPIPYIRLQCCIRYYWPHVLRWMQFIANFNDVRLNLNRRAHRRGVKRDQ